MKYTNLGDTGISVSRLCLGMMTYGSTEWRDWVLNYDDALPFVERALDARASMNAIGDMNRLLSGKWFDATRPRGHANASGPERANQCDELKWVCLPSIPSVCETFASSPRQREQYAFWPG